MGSPPPPVLPVTRGTPDSGFLEVSAVGSAYTGLRFPPSLEQGPPRNALLQPGSLRKLCGSSVINRLYFYLVPFRHVILWDRNDLWRGRKAHLPPPI